MISTIGARKKIRTIDPLELGWLAIVILVPLAINPWGSNAFELPKAALLQAFALTLGLIALVRMIETRAAIERARGVWLALAFALTLIFATVFSINPRASIWGDYARAQGLLTRLAALALFLIVAIFLRTRAQADRLWRALIWTSAPIVIYAFAQTFHLDPLDWRTDAVSPLVATLGRSNFIGTYLVLILPLTFARMIYSSRKPVYALLILAQLLCLVLTQSRGAWVALMGVIILGASSYGFARDKRVVFAFLIGTIFLIALLVPFSNRLIQLARVDEGSTAARLTIWQTTLQLIAARPALGYGLETMQFAFAREFPPQLVYYQGKQFAVDRAHNVWLDLAMNAGVIGALMFAALIVNLARRAWVRWRARDDRWERTLWLALAGAVAGHLLDLEFTFDVIGTATVFWLILGLSAALARGVNAPAIAPIAPRDFAARARAAFIALCAALVIATICVRPLLADIYSRESQIATRALDARIRAGERAIQLWSLEPEYHFQLAWLYFERGTLFDVENALRAAEQLNPDEPRVWATRGDMSARIAQYDAAEIAYRHAIARAPNIATYHAALGWTLAQQSRYREAAIELRRAVDLDATDALVFRELGNLYKMLGQETEATWAWQEAARWSRK